jgi:hypothetical protein
MRSDVGQQVTKTDEETANYERGSVMKDGPGDACNSIKQRCCICELSMILQSFGSEPTANFR